MKKNKVDVIWGEAESTRRPARPGRSPCRNEARRAAQGRARAGRYSATHIIVATGRAPARAARHRARQEADLDLLRGHGAGPDAEIAPGHGVGRDRHRVRVLLPHHGAEVTVVECCRRSCRSRIAEIAALARKRFEKQGIKILTGAKVTKVEKGSDQVTATIDDGKGGTQAITAERMISAVGVVGNIENLGLEKLGVTIERGIVKTDGLGRTNVPGIYAIGDVAGPPMLAHKAEHEGERCIDAIKGLHAEPLDNGKIPGCTYCNPQIASVGITEAKAKEQGLDVRVGRFPFVGNGKAIALGEPEGLVKTIFDKKTGQLLGAHMVGAEVTS
jgi:dihydrolipoamide dehydrogenase